jgi:hypothetical protein
MLRVKLELLVKPLSFEFNKDADQFKGLTRALAGELGGKNVRVNVMLPGYIETDMTGCT